MNEELTSAAPASLDVVIVGGGHNGLVAAAYLARAGLSVTVLERLSAVGGAAVSASPFEGVDARLSRYSYLVSLLPQSIIDNLGLDLTLRRRRYSSYTPVPGADTGLLVDSGDPAATLCSFERIGAARDAANFSEFYEHTRRIAEAVWPTLTEPLPTRSELRARLGADHIWSAMIERPIGEIITRHHENDVVRGVILTDALIGTFARASDESLAQNICFLYHLIGGGTGDWDVPVGGMGAVTAALEAAALKAGARIVTDAEVTAIEVGGGRGTAGAGGDVEAGAAHRDVEAGAAHRDVEASAAGGEGWAGAIVRFRVGGGADQELGAGIVLANVAPLELERLVAAGRAAASARPGGTAATGDAGQNEATPSSGPEGAQAKVNLMLTRLPRLRDPNVSPEAAFGGTFHINETFSQLDSGYLQAESGHVPSPLPAEIYCHSLTDPSILSPELRAAGAQTLTLFALHVPNRLVTEATNDAFRAEVQEAALASLNSVLAEPVEACIMLDEKGEPCIETKTTLDLEHALRMPGGNIFHGPLSWPFVEDDADLSTPAARWGVATAHEGILLCGSGSRRGGAVSGLGGHSAAMAVLESQGQSNGGRSQAGPTGETLPGGAG